MGSRGAEGRVRGPGGPPGLPHIFSFANESSMTSSPSRAAPDPVAERLHSAAIHLLRRVRRADEASGMSAPQLSALSVIVFGGPLTVGELADAEQVRPPTISRLLTRLEGEGLVVREVDAADRRVVRVRATEAGVRVLEEGRRRRITALSGQLRGMAEADLEVLERAVLLVEEMLRREW